MKNINYNLVLQTAVMAGKAIIHIYNHKDFNVEIKNDNTPLTIADKASHEIIVQALKETNIPIVSEEGDDNDYQRRKHLKTFWLIDPLDGTKEFIQRNGEFTVNIALISDKKTVAGIIFIPVTKTLYLGIRDRGAWKLQLNDFDDVSHLYDRLINSPKLKVNTDIKDRITVLASKSHINDKTQNYIADLSKSYKLDIKNYGSSLKFCMIAEGEAHIYPRLSPTMEWDTAAGHAIAVAAGANVLDRQNGNELQYNKENLRNPYFLVSVGKKPLIL